MALSSCVPPPHQKRGCLQEGRPALPRPAPPRPAPASPGAASQSARGSPHHLTGRVQSRTETKIIIACEARKDRRKGEGGAPTCSCCSSTAFCSLSLVYISSRAASRRRSSFSCSMHSASESSSSAMPARSPPSSPAAGAAAGCAPPGPAPASHGCAGVRLQGRRGAGGRCIGGCRAGAWEGAAGRPRPGRGLDPQGRPGGWLGDGCPGGAPPLHARPGLVHPAEGGGEHGSRRSVGHEQVVVHCAWVRLRHAPAACTACGIYFQSLD